MDATRCQTLCHICNLDKKTYEVGIIKSTLQTRKNGSEHLTNLPNATQLATKKRQGSNPHTNDFRAL